MTTSKTLPRDEATLLLGIYASHSCGSMGIERQAFENAAAWAGYGIPENVKHLLKCLEDKRLIVPQPDHTIGMTEAGEILSGMLLAQRSRHND